MPIKVREEQQLRHIVSFRVSDQELEMLKRLGGTSTARLSDVLRQLVKQVCESGSVGHHLVPGRYTCNG